MIDTIRNIFKIDELRSRVLFTLSILAIERIGVHIVTPGVDVAVLSDAWKEMSGTLLSLYDMFTGGAFQKAAIFGLGIMPYISASIILQLMGAVVPFFQRLQKEGEEGRRKITQYTRYGTLAISAAQAFGVAIFLESLTGSNGAPVVPNPGLMFKFTTVLTMATGTIFVMWLGEQITERGIGNGISLIIFIGIIAGLPQAIQQEWQSMQIGQTSLLAELIVLAIGFGIIYFVVWMTQAVRKIPVQYAKRVVGRKVYGGSNTYFPLKLNAAGVMPIIFAQAIMFIPQTIVNFLPASSFGDFIVGLFAFDSWFYWAFYFVMIVFFTYFYTAISLNPVEVAENLKKNGGFIPGVRPGKKTSEFLDNVLTKLTLPGSILLGLVAIVPYFLTEFAGINFNYASFYGGTGLLIIVGVALDTLQQIESHLYMRHYDGFLKGTKIKGRR
jgi:preprotein translocase subunit SecY